MAPKTKFSREEIVDTALAIATTEGMAGITARGVAARLGCSVAPIYVNFDTIDDLVAAVMERVRALSGQLIARQPGENLFERIGRASLAFARDYPVLFREFVMVPNPHRATLDSGRQEWVDALGQDPELAGLDPEVQRRVFFKLQVFQTGLSVMIANGLAPDWLDEGRAEELLLETGAELLEGVRRSSGKRGVAVE